MHSSGTYQVGDRVLAPWEPLFLYAGTIHRLKGQRARIVFDDGDSGWAHLADLQPLAFTHGQGVFSRRDNSYQYLPATVEQIDGKSLALHFDDGEEWVHVSMVRVLRFDVLRQAPRDQLLARFRAFQERVRVGEHVLAPWAACTLFAGTVSELRDTRAHVRFDDGDSGWVLIAQLLPLEVHIGQRLLTRSCFSAQFYPTVVVGVADNSALVRYRDGCEMWTRFAALCVPCMPLGPNAQPSGMTRLRGWLVWGNWLVPVGLMLFASGKGCG